MQESSLLHLEIFQYFVWHVLHFTLRQYNYHYFFCKLLIFSMHSFMHVFTLWMQMTECTKYGNIRKGRHQNFREIQCKDRREEGEFAFSYWICTDLSDHLNGPWKWRNSANCRRNCSPVNINGRPLSHNVWGHFNFPMLNPYSPVCKIIWTPPLPASTLSLTTHVMWQ